MEQENGKGRRDGEWNGRGVEGRRGGGRAEGREGNVWEEIERENGKERRDVKWK